MSTISPVITVENVTKKFGNFKAVDDITFNIHQGEIIGFVGANGAGKTTTISMLLGFTGTSAGKVRVLERDILPQNAHLSHVNIGYAAGDMELPGQLTGEQYLSFLQSQGGHVDPAWFAQLCARFTPQLNKKIHTLSRGNKQKIALVAAFSRDPDLVILDEPTSGLDPAMQEAFLDLVRDYRQRQKTIFMSSHYLQEVMEVCSRVMLMQSGRILQDIQTAELLLQGGKQVTIKSRYKPTKPPANAESVEQSFNNGVVTMSFVYKGGITKLHEWLSGLEQLDDIEISEYNLEETFSSLYKPENAS